MTNVALVETLRFAVALAGLARIERGCCETEPRCICAPVLDTQPILERGDVLLYGGGPPGQAAAVFVALARALDALSTAPGGLMHPLPALLGTDGREDEP